MSGLFGGSKTKSTSNNQAYGTLSDNFGGLLGNAGTGANALSALLSGDTSGFQKFKDATGFNFESQEGSRGITGNNAARGLLRSGSTGQALVNYGNEIENKYANNYMDRLLNQSNLGFQAGGLLAQAGQQSNSKSKSKPGLGGFLGQMAGGVAASDRRLKKDVEQIGTYGDLPLFRYSYINVPGEQIGVMAQDVAKHYPRALGPEVFGYLTVDYDKLREEVANEPA